MLLCLHVCCISKCILHKLFMSQMYYMPGFVSGIINCFCCLKKVSFFWVYIQAAVLTLQRRLFNFKIAFAWTIHHIQLLLESLDLSRITRKFRHFDDMNILWESMFVSKLFVFKLKNYICGFLFEKSQHVSWFFWNIEQGAVEFL